MRILFFIVVPGTTTAPSRSLKRVTMVYGYVSTVDNRPERDTVTEGGSRKSAKWVRCDKLPKYGNCHVAVLHVLSRDFPHPARINSRSDDILSL